MLKNESRLKPLQPVKNCYKKLSQNVKTYLVTILTADGTALADNLGIPLSQDAEPSGECQGLAEDFCQRGYTEAQTTISAGRRYVNIAVDQSASEDHK